MIVVLIIAVLATIIIALTINGARRGRESSLRGNLHELRTGVERFQADCGALPPALADLVAGSSSEISADADGRGVALDRSGYKGPYVITGDGGLPSDPITRSVDWEYDNTTGELRSRSTAAGLNGVPYCNW
jgi:type II secretory pathway pseudopilin PulG